MQRIWEFAPWFPYKIGMGKLVAHCRFLNSAEVFSAGMSPGQKRNAPFPVPQLELTLPNFPVDCFIWEAFTLVSERMRAAMALPPDDVEYFPVDSSRSSPGVQAMDYRVMSVAVTDRVSHPREVRPDRIGAVIPDASAIDIESKPKHRLFHDEQFVGLIYCTDELAVAVLEAGCTGVRFFDPRHRDPIRPMRFRTLRGVEEEGDWDPVKKIEHTTVVESVTQT